MKYRFICHSLFSSIVSLSETFEFADRTTLVLRIDELFLKGVDEFVERDRRGVGSSRFHIEFAHDFRHNALGHEIIRTFLREVQDVREREARIGVQSVVRFGSHSKAIYQARQLTAIRQDELAPRNAEHLHYVKSPNVSVANPMPFLQCDAYGWGFSLCNLWRELVNGQTGFSSKGTQRPPTKLHSMDVPSGPLQTLAVNFQAHW
ncbi:BQ2448_339 [Microbotryum intermedium]|uniref:BQ2448_339 protein n=1 Tax=Microbotryum intermedium TaxID=269621 RepID=A0A238FAR5_9BASI|nr:BQ2448_339 [Microbotryum intermedium]